LLLEAVKKFLAALQVRWRQVPVIIGEPGQQVVVFNSFLAYFLSPIRPDLYVPKPLAAVIFKRFPGVVFKKFKKFIVRPFFIILWEVVTGIDWQPVFFILCHNIPF
jgi:hypothetical protein